ncbi:mechanosensitive ion channel family protein [Bacillus mesophilum]|uniref:Mechanosensitive ion channel family protein n=1 Tax=Bacillus mesophilum TaxID=1071718 RepID=A0A7V7RM02_9BACI|nr:mechanosensitive ion channel family protein [Bacillus mesophilum]KAB2332829.1 mechanosensitive ion channel family protein [Bacillus mesophilum]
MNWALFYDVDMWTQIGISIGIFLLFLVFRKLFSKYIYSLILRLSNKAPTDMLRHIFVSFEKPLQWLFIIIGIEIASRYFPFRPAPDGLFNSFISASVIVLITWGLYNLASASSIFFAKVKNRFKLEIDDILIPFMSKAIRIIIVAISITIIAQEFEYDVTGFIAGLGLGGVAIAFAAKDAIGNLFGGFIIITEKPFTIGDWIMTPSVEGTVEDITFRSTKVRTFADAIVTVPNNTLANESITNWSKMGKRQVSFNIKISYETPKAKLLRVVRQMEEVIKGHSEVHPDSILVRFDKYQENGYEVFIYFFTKSTAWAEHLRVKEEINFRLIEILESEDVSIALPSRKLYASEPDEDKGSLPAPQES